MADDDRYWRRKGTTGEPPAPLEQIRTGFYGSRILGSLTEVTVGCIVWAHTDGDLTKIRLTAGGEPRGGIVLETYAAIDQAWLRETGEPIERKHFRCWDWEQPRGSEISTLTETQIVADGCEAPSPPLIARQIRRMLRPVADRQVSILDVNEARTLHDAAHLAAVLTGTRT